MFGYGIRLRLALVAVDTGMVQYSDERNRQFFDQALARMAAIPGVEAAALATRPPFSVNYNRCNIWIEGRHRAGEQGDPVEVTTVSPDCTPFSMTVMPRRLRPATMERFCTVESDFTTKTKSPL